MIKKDIEEKPRERQSLRPGKGEDRLEE